MRTPRTTRRPRRAWSLNKPPVAALEPADISNAVLYLVSDAGRYVTGIAHVVDAGGQL